MQYTVVHSKDPYLLARLATDLQMEGAESDEEWNKNYNPFSDPEYYYPNEWLYIYQYSGFAFHNHCETCNHISHELTSRNYIKVLTQILEP